MAAAVVLQLCGCWEYYQHYKDLKMFVYTLLILFFKLPHESCEKQATFFKKEKKKAHLFYFGVCLTVKLGT